MLKYRLLAGTGMIAVIFAVLYFDRYAAPFFPALLAITLLVGFAATWELIELLPSIYRPDRTSAIPAVLGVLAVNWYEPVRRHLELGFLPAFADPWQPVLIVAVLASMMAFSHEMYHRPSSADRLPKIAFTMFAVTYFGLLGSFLLRLRWADVYNDVDYGAWLLALLIFVPKVGDIGAYFIGRAIGRLPLAPNLSPKKTWEGFIGGLCAAGLISVLLNRFASGGLFRYGDMEAIGFGILIGAAGVFGDLAESLIKRDCGAKDAGKRIPGFGGVLDVIDSILFSAPVAYLWLTRN